MCICRCVWAGLSSPLILTVGEFGPADCFLHPLQFWQRLSASEMKEHRESSSNLSESSKENLSPSSHSANISSIASTSPTKGSGVPRAAALRPRPLYALKWMVEAEPEQPDRPGEAQDWPGGMGDHHRNTAESKRPQAPLNDHKKRDLKLKTPLFTCLCASLKTYKVELYILRVQLCFLRRWQVH